MKLVGVDVAGVVALSFVQLIFVLTKPMPRFMHTRKVEKHQSKTQAKICTNGTVWQDGYCHSTLRHIGQTDCHAG